MKRKVYHSGYCPLIESERIINLTVADFNVIGSLSTQHKITGFQCSDAINCKHYKDSPTGLCPLADTYTP